MRYACLGLFSIGLMFALHPLPAEPWGILGLGDLFFGYLLASVAALVFIVADIRARQRSYERHRVAISIAERRTLRRQPERRAA